jgi:hypothetical protein
MKKRISRKPPTGAPEGTVWFGGPVDRFKITLRLFGEQLDPDEISALLGCTPTKAERKGIPISSADGGIHIPKTGRWSVTIHSEDCDESSDVNDGVKILLEELPSDPALWKSLTGTYTADVYCSLFLESSNRGFEISAEVSRMLSERNLPISFDIYFDMPELPE